jgi:cytochrome c-type biogenesis protein CcmF
LELDTNIHWPSAPNWALFAGELGRFAILASLIAFLVSILTWVLAKRQTKLEPIARAAFGVGCAGILVASICLWSLFLGDQFEFNSVKASSEQNLATKYKFAAFWAHQEGSFLLWALASAALGYFAAMGAKSYRRWFTVTYSAFLACLCAILAYESPFKMTLTHGKALVLPKGDGLTPALQNYWVVIHPPTIFFGFGSLTVLFAYGVAATLCGNTTDWIKQLRPWALLSATLLGCGLCMGGFWAYETLGWGGFWAWDPVEISSFIPWILATTLVHGLLVQATKGRWIRANLILAGLPFVAFVYGTFLTRSGLYSDVSNHSFAEMDKSALKILLGLLVAVIFVFVALCAWRMPRIKETRSEESDANREGLYQSSMILLAGIGLASAIGMSVPLIMYLQGHKAKIVEAGLYDRVLSWPFIPVILLIGITPFVGWRGAPWKTQLLKYVNPASFAFFAAGLILFALRSPQLGLHLEKLDPVGFPVGLQVPALPWIGFLLFLCLFAIFANATRIVEMKKASKLSLGGFIAHMGVATLMAGLIVSHGLERTETTVVWDGHPAMALDYLISHKPEQGNLFDRDHHSTFDLQGPGGAFALHPGLYFTRNNNDDLSPMVWPDIKRSGLYDIYFALAPPITDVWSQPVEMRPGESQTSNNVIVKYRKFNMIGSPGAPGTQFVAELSVTTKNGTFLSKPSLELAEEGLRPNLGAVDGDIVTSLSAIQPGDDTAQIQVHFARPRYEVQLFYKPLTIFVWLGAFLITLGGMMAAWYRRNATPPESPVPGEAGTESLRNLEPVGTASE